MRKNRIFEINLLINFAAFFILGLLIRFSHMQQAFIIILPFVSMVSIQHIMLAKRKKKQKQKKPMIDDSC